MPAIQRHSTAIKFVAAAAMLTMLGACASSDSLFAGDKIDYRSKASKAPTLDVPPDLTQLARDGRYTPQASGAVSASSYQTGGAATTTASASRATATVAPTTVGDFRMMRSGNQRWLVTSIPAEALWPQLRAFWQERGLNLAVDSPEAGVMETSWAENRAKLDDDILRRALGRVLDSIFSTGTRDKFRVRIERNTSSNGTEIYLTHFGMEEVLTGAQRDTTTWASRPNDPQLEGEMLQRLMVRLGTREEDAKTVVAGAAVGGAASTSARARLVEVPGSGTTLQLDDNFDRAWRRVGIALDRNGFTVEDRDRSAGTYFVRYADPRTTAKEDPGFFARLFSGASDNTPQRYRVEVKGEGERSVVRVLNAQGAADTTGVSTRILTLLDAELR
jgi:outer membrane protein assembly factor BamC